MNLSTVTIPRTGARQTAAEYRRESRRSTNPREAQELAEIARAYEIAANENVALIALTPTIEAGGTLVRTRVFRAGRDDESREHYAVPRMAVSRWDAAFCYTSGVLQNGHVVFSDSLNRQWRYASGVRYLATNFELPEGFSSGRADVQTAWQAWTAMVPIVPPKHRPRRGMGKRLVLWEVDDWTWTEIPAPPRDPALLRHVGGDLYAVEAVWDLTELERLVLSGRRP